MTSPGSHVRECRPSGFFVSQIYPITGAKTPCQERTLVQYEEAPARIHNSSGIPAKPTSLLGVFPSVGGLALGVRLFYGVVGCTGGALDGPIPGNHLQ